MRTVESTTAHAALHEVRKHSPRRSEMDQPAAAGERRRRAPFLPKRSWVSGPGGDLAHSASAAAKGSRESLIRSEEDLRGGGRRGRAVEPATRGTGALEMPGLRSQENGTAEAEGWNGEGWQREAAPEEEGRRDLLRWGRSCS